MEALLNSSSSVCFILNAPKMAITTGSLLRDPNLYMKAANGYSSLSLSAPFTTHKLSVAFRDSVIVGAKNSKNKKADGHSFVPKPDEATGPFPEAVLLKEKKVQDGKLLPEFADEEEEKFYETLMLQLESETAVEQMRHYEVVYLIHEKHAEEVGNVNEKVQDFLREKKGKIWRLSDWGMRRLAYKINKAKNAHYILMNFELEAKWINDFKGMLDKDERVIRHLVIKRDEAITEDCPPPPEFHTLRAGTDDYDEEEEDIDYDDAYDYEDDKEDWDGEGEEGEMEDYDDETEDGIIAVKNEAGDREHKNNISAIARNKGRKNLRSEKVGR
ncbi:glutamic acid-rich protein [Juglans microcarpa x Juglans regia]|uniref:glutamic acid-rich protein n=1 Tax=Juglans microcarpa x Juglans regia TaxID=2249226 RepID=UPI001B7DA0DA|nr:glutamic acid-rich protein [Juglans microcarpa x Juglans regia]